LRGRFCALRARGFSFYAVLAACVAGGRMRLCSCGFKEKRAGLSFERWLLCPAGTGAFFYLLFGPPPARARRGRLWGCAPFSAPLASPPKHPAGVFQHPTFREGCAAAASGASSLRSVISLRAAQCQHTPSRWMQGQGRLAGLRHCGGLGRYVCFMFGELQLQRTAAHATHRSFCSFSDRAGIVTREAS